MPVMRMPFTRSSFSHKGEQWEKKSNQNRCVARRAPIFWSQFQCSLRVARTPPLRPYIGARTITQSLARTTIGPSVCDFSVSILLKNLLGFRLLRQCISYQCESVCDTISLVFAPSAGSMVSDRVEEIFVICEKVEITIEIRKRERDL